jgi:hypothetical protein
MKRPRMGQDKPALRMMCLLRDRPWRIVAVLTAVGLFLVLALPPGNVDESLRAIDAAHVVPEEENAARIYTELAWDPNLPSLDPSVLPEPVLSATWDRPWRDAEFPQAAQWIDERQAVLDVLQAAAGKSQCWFSVFEGRWQARERSGTGCQLASLLRRAANRDLGEGRTDAGLEKLLCVFRMARHFLAQDSPQDYLAGRSMAWSGLRRFYKLVILEDVPPERLARLEAALPPIEDISNERSRQLERVRALYEQEYPRRFRERLKSVFFPRSYSRERDESNRIFLGRCRAARVLLALRRYKNDTGAWPADLRALGTRLPSEALLDPLSGKPFAYRLRGDGFLLYSLSVNGADEGGKPRDDFLFWPDH